MEKGIFSIPIYKQKALKNFNYKYNLKNTEKVAKECISIPIYPELSSDSVKHISKIINDYQ